MLVKTHSNVKFYSDTGHNCPVYISVIAAYRMVEMFCYSSYFWNQYSQVRKLKLILIV